MAGAGVVLVAAGVVPWYQDADHALDATRHRGGTTGQATVSAAHTVQVKSDGEPRSVRIPALGVSSRVVPIRVRGQTLVPPSDPQLLGWWVGGAEPGAAEGSAVVTGHTVHTGGGAFDDLEDLRSGDRVVVRTDHERLRYAVTRVRTYDTGSLARHAGAIFSQDVRGRLVLVTCEDWNGTSYESNVVVTAR